MAQDHKPEPDSPRASDSKNRADKTPDHPRDEALVDETLEDTFPASDPPAWTSDPGGGEPARPDNPD